MFSQYIKGLPMRCFGPISILLLVTLQQACQHDMPIAPLAADVIPGAPVQLAFVTQPPSSVEGAVVLSPPVQVAVQDSSGNTVSGASDTVTITIDPNASGATLQGTTTTVAVDGIATFDDLRVDRPGDGYTLTAAAPGLGGATSAAFAVHLTFATVSASSVHTCAVTTSGAAYCWGDNGFGQLGDGTTSRQISPVLVAGGVRFAAIGAGSGITCGVTNSGAAYCWGSNSNGQVGDGTTIDRTTPTAVSGGLTFSTVSVGGGHACGLTTGGETYCWGANYDGQLGDGTETDRASPTRVVGGRAFSAVSAGSSHTCAVASTGVAWCWGFSGFGQLGDGQTLVDRRVPGPVVSPVAFAAVSAGGNHTCGVAAGGAAYCWGYNGDGNLGDGTTMLRTTPVAVAGELHFAAVHAGAYHTCGVTASNAPYCWGSIHNNTGQLGDGTFNGRMTPGLVAGGLAFAEVSAGPWHTCGVTTSGTAYCWGFNGQGELGDGTTTLRLAPVRVLQ